jgi:hypothetical protein
MIIDWNAALARWEELSLALKTLGAEEKALREQLFAGSFPSPKEGVNTSDPLPDGRTLKGTYKINRTVVMDKVTDLKVDINTFNSLFKLKYDLVTAQYRLLDPKLQKKVDAVLKIQPGLPSLEIVAAKPKTPTVEAPE